MVVGLKKFVSKILDYRNFTVATWITYLFMFSIFFYWCTGRIDPDFGWHLGMGQEIMTNGIPDKDPFTHALPDHNYIDHEWLSDVVVWFIYEIGGYALLSFFYALLLTVAIWFAVGRRAHVFYLVPMALMVSPYIGVRTVVYTIFFSSLLLWVLRKKLYVYIPLLMLIWANIHGSFLLGVLILVHTATVGKVYKLFFYTLLCIILSFVNPYGLNMYLEIWSIMGDSGLPDSIIEWQRFDFAFAYIPFVAIWLAGLLFSKNLSWRTIFRLDVVMFLLALTSIRHIPLFAFTAIYYIVQDYDHLLRGARKQDVVSLRIKGRSLAVSFILIVALAAVSFDDWKRSSNPEGNYPLQIAGHLNKFPCDGNMFNEYGIGGYFIWKVPGDKVFIDGRGPSWMYGDERFVKTYLRIKDEPSYRKQLFSKHNVGCVIVQKDDDIVKSLLEDKDWRTTVEANGYILIRKDTPY